MHKGVQGCAKVCKCVQRCTNNVVCKRSGACIVHKERDDPIMVCTMSHSPYTPTMDTPTHTSWPAKQLTTLTQSNILWSSTCSSRSLLVGGGAWLWMTGNSCCMCIHWGLGVASLLCRLGAHSHHFWLETTNHCTEGESPLEREGGHQVMCVTSWAPRSASTLQRP